MFVGLVIASIVIASIVLLLTVLILRRSKPSADADKPTRVPRWFIAVDTVICRLVRNPLVALPNVELMSVRETIEMADGHLLDHTRVYPSSPASPLPTILFRTPYGKRLWFGTACRFASRGYCVIVQDCRLANTDTDHVFSVKQEGEDGCRTLEWIAKQDWCNQRVGMSGQSYMGICTYAVVHSAPAMLKAIVPVNCSSDIHQVLFPTPGSFRLDLVVRWLYLVLVVNDGTTSFFRRVYRRLRLTSVANSAVRHLPVSDIDRRLFGKEMGLFRFGLQDHDPKSVFWTQTLGEEKCNLGNAPPSCLIGGWHDIFLRSQLNDWMELVKISKSREKDEIHPLHALVIGPWHHFQFKPQSAVLNKTTLEWFDAHLKQDSYALERFPPVLLHFSGLPSTESSWRRFQHFPPLNVVSMPFFLRNNLLLDKIPPFDEHSISFTFDALHDPTPSAGGTSFDPQNAGSMRQNEFENRSDVLVFTSEPLKRRMTIVGFVRTTLYVNSSSISSDWIGRLCSVSPDKVSMNLCDGICRIAHPSQSITKVDIDMWATAHVFQPGHAIRFHVCSGAYPRFSRNSGTGDCHSATEDAFQPVLQTVYASPDMPSRLILPTYTENKS